jgi:hypothetical protein
LFKINNNKIYEKHKENIEKIIDEEVKQFENINIFT